MEGIGDLYLGITPIRNCRVVLTPQDIFLRAYYELPIGLIEVQFNLDRREILWHGKAEYNEKIECEIVEEKHIHTAFYFSVPSEKSAVVCQARTNLDELGAQVGINKPIAAFSATALETLIHELHTKLLIRLADDLKSYEHIYAKLEMINPNNNVITTFSDHSKRPKREQDDEVDWELSTRKYSRSLSDYLQSTNLPGTPDHRLRRSELQPSLTGGYLSAQRTVKPMTSGYLGLFQRSPQFSRSASAYLQPSKKVSKEKFTDHLPLFENDSSDDTEGQWSTSSSGDPIESTGVGLDYFEIENYAIVILSLKDTIRSLSKKLKHER